MVDEIDDEDTDITVADAQQYKPGAEAGDIIEICSTQRTSAE